MQNDYREQYSPEAWAEQTDNGKHIVAPENMDTGAEFYAGTAEDLLFRYLNAKHIVAKWLDKNGLQGFTELIDRLNNGEDFNTAYDHWIPACREELSIKNRAHPIGFE